MDPLSGILSLLKPRSYITAGFNAGGDWSLRLDDLAGRIKCYAVVSGGCWLLLEEDGEPLKLVTGDCFVLPSGRHVRIASDLALDATLASEALSPDRDGETVTYNGGGDVLLVGSRFEVSGRHANELLQTLPPVIHLRRAEEQATLRWSIELMMQELREARPGASLMAQHLAHMMLVQTLRLYLSQQSGAGFGWFAALGDPPVGAALSAIHADPAHNWNLEELAAKAGMSRTVFARRFREKVGETPVAYVTRWRMMLAAERLMSSRDPLSRIASSVGYESENSFNTAFRRVMGSSPRRYARAQEQTD
ncbi:AraC family transcriptional regulator [Mesorhizobium sp. STM 4661]|uniref:AraC family transcriptional regulator n=1 Tax=Mesorhizobium sp. STM 4661 TaxID=1297570 RepID=UPI0002BE88F3|nr:AraC family transcriptional regulator [Mesorhizobium sp. STM 4661]CCV13947.1 putative araC-like transcription regulator [Mesorhizobium sp. STM 4661]